MPRSLLHLWPPFQNRNDQRPCWRILHRAIWCRETDRHSTAYGDHMMYIHMYIVSFISESFLHFWSLSWFCHTIFFFASSLFRFKPEIFKFTVVETFSTNTWLVQHAALWTIKSYYWDLWYGKVGLLIVASVPQPNNVNSFVFLADIYCNFLTTVLLVLVLSPLKRDGIFI